MNSHARLPRATPAFMLTSVICLLSGCAKLPAATPPDAAHPPETAISEIAQTYKSYRPITEKPVFVNPELAMLCRGASESEVVAARKTMGPHANTAIMIFMNETAARTFAAGAGTYEPGAVIVKEKMPLGHWVEGTQTRVRPHEGVGGMVKRAAGFDPKHGDWEYFYFENPAKIETGAIASCVKCHEGAKKKDYVFGSWAPRPEFSTRPLP